MLRVTQHYMYYGYHLCYLLLKRRLQDLHKTTCDCFVYLCFTIINVGIITLLYVNREGPRDIFLQYGNKLPNIFFWKVSLKKFIHIFEVTQQEYYMYINLLFRKMYTINEKNYLRNTDGVKYLDFFYSSTSELDKWLKHIIKML